MKTPINNEAHDDLNISMSRAILTGLKSKWLCGYRVAISGAPYRDHVSAAFSAGYRQGVQDMTKAQQAAEAFAKENH